MPALSALNMRLRDDYVQDCASGITRWNRVIEKAGIDFELTLPHVAFNRHIGEFAKVHADVDGRVRRTSGMGRRSRRRTLPNGGDAEFITGLMQPEARPGHFAGWIAPPKAGIDNKPGEFEYVPIHE